MIQVIALAAVALAVVGLIAGLVIKLSSAVDGERAALVVEGIANRAQLAAERERDLAIADAALARSERAAMKVQLVATQRQGNADHAEVIQRVKDKLLSGSAADASNFLRDLLSSPVLPDAADGDGASDDRGLAEPRPVQPAAD